MRVSRTSKAVAVIELQPILAGVAKDDIQVAVSVHIGEHDRPGVVPLRVQGPRCDLCELRLRDQGA